MRSKDRDRWDATVKEGSAFLGGKSAAFPRQRLYCLRELRDCPSNRGHLAVAIKGFSYGSPTLGER